MSTSCLPYEAFGNLVHSSNQGSAPIAESASGHPAYRWQLRSEPSGQCQHLRSREHPDNKTCVRLGGSDLTPVYSTGSTKGQLGDELHSTDRRFASPPRFH